MSNKMHSEHDHICGRCGASVDIQDKRCGCGADLMTMSECVSDIPKFVITPEFVAKMSQIERTLASAKGEPWQ